MRHISSYERYTPREDALLKEHYFSMGPTRMLRAGMLTNKNVPSLVHRAKFLGLRYDTKLIGSQCLNLENVDDLIYVRTPFAAYMLGFLWADGFISKNTYYIGFKIVSKDFDDIKEHWLRTASWRYCVEDDGNAAHQPQAKVGLNHRGFHDFLIQHGYVFKSGESANLVLDAVPSHLKHYWWRGYFDGDGGFTVHGWTRRISLTSTYDQDWSFFAGLAKELKLGYRLVRHKIIHKGKKSNRSNILINDEANLRRFMNYIYQGEQFGLCRKRKLYDEYLEYKASSYPDKTSRFRGVCRPAGKTYWQMQIYKGKHIRKVFHNEIEAAKEYDKLAIELFGNKAVLNFPPV